MDALERDWPWDQAPNVAAITTRAVLDGAPVLVVAHDAEDGGWQFLDGGDADPAEARLIAMRRVLDLDASLLDITDLPVGWVATRTDARMPWLRAPRGG